MNNVIQSEKAELFQERHRQTTNSKKKKLKDQMMNAKKKKKSSVGSVERKGRSEPGSATSRKSGKLQKNFLEDENSAYEFGDYYQQISESSMIDLGMLSDTFNDENQEKLIREKEEKEYQSRLKAGKKSVAFKDLDAYDPKIYKRVTSRTTARNTS